MRVIGMISGTSHDGIDCAVVDFELVGSVLEATIVDESVTPYEPALRARLRAALPPAAVSLEEVCILDTLIGDAFAAVAAAAVERVGDVEAITSHGQTVFHWVVDNHARGTLQLGQPAWIAERTGCAVISDVRIRDITVGGHGAPLVSVLDRLLVGTTPGTTALLNLGGISNVTLVDDGDVRVAFDIGPANALLDAVMVEAEGEGSYDADGALAATGTVDEALLAVLLDEPYYALPAPKSTGKELFHLGYVHAALAATSADGTARPALADLLATLTELTARTVATAVAAAGATRLLVSGGGVANTAMIERLVAAMPDVEVTTTVDLGVPTATKEAIAFALIGWCTLHGVAANEPTATGAAARRVLGTITPGAQPLALPTPVTTPLTAIRFQAAPR